MPCRVFTLPGSGAESRVLMVYWKLEVALAHRSLQTQQVYRIAARLDAVSYLSRPARIASVFQSSFAGDSRVVQYHKLLLWY
jgi:hypothetical protein